MTTILVVVMCVAGYLVVAGYLLMVVAVLMEAAGTRIHLVEGSSGGGRGEERERCPACGGSHL